MLTLQPYHVTRYPPSGPKWVQFGDDIVNGAVDDVRAALERKKQWKSEYHLTRLQDDRMTPLNHFSSHRDPEEQATDAFDHPHPPPHQPEHPHRPEEPDMDMGGDSDVEMSSPPGRPPSPPPPSRTMRDIGTGPDRRDMEEMGVQAGGGPPPPPDRRHIGTNTENPRSEAGTQASFQPPPPPPPPDRSTVPRERRSRSPVEMTTRSHKPPPPPPDANALVPVQRRQKEPKDVLMVSSSNGKPPPGGGGGMEIDRPVVRKRASEMDIGEAMKDTAMAAARSRRQGELERKGDKKEFIKDIQNAHLAHHMQQKQASAEMARNHATETRDLRHQRDVAVGALERGRQATHVAPTIAYPNQADAATVAYPPHVQHFDISGRSRSPLLPTGSGRSVSSMHSHSHDSRNDALSAYSKYARSRSRK